MATEKTPLKIYRGTNGTNTSSGSVPALQAGTLIFNEGLGFFTLDVNTSKANVSDAAKALLKDTVDFMNESLSSTDSFKILNSNDNNNIMRLPLLASGAFYATYADRATQANMANYTQLDNDAEKSWKHSINDSFLHTNDEYILTDNKIYRQIIKTDNAVDEEQVTGTDNIFINYVAQAEQSTKQPTTFYNKVTIGNKFALAVDPATGNTNTFKDLGLLSPSFYLERYATFQTEDDIKLAPANNDNIEYDQKIVLARYDADNSKLENTVLIKNRQKSLFKFGAAASSSYIPTTDYDFVTLAYMRDNAGGKAIFRRWS